jgi:hypothetical protein
MSRRRRPRLDELAAAGAAPANGKPPVNGTPFRWSATPPASADDGRHPVYDNPAELTRLANLSVNDPPRWAAEKERLKRDMGLSLPDLERVVRHVASSLPTPPPAPVTRPAYYASGHITYKAGSPPIPLCNFVARIVADVTTDDGVECRRRLRLVGRLDAGDELPEVEVPAERFAGMDWPMTEWGTRAIVSAGAGSKDHLRAAVLTLSGDVKRETVYAHTGWREVGGRWVYLHAGGAVGADGPAASVRVALPPQLALYALPSPPAGEPLRDAVRASLGLLRGLAPAEVTVPLLIAPYRAAVGGADFTLGLIGRTGAGKSELAALAQQHFGAGLDARHLPANWSSTANATEALAFAAKDALLVIDDYCPASLNDAAKLQSAADRLIRGQGNHAGRSRMTAGAELRAGKPPRGLILSTGEDQPGGASLRARLWTVEVGREAVNFDRLKECQRAAKAGRYAESLAGFVKWLARDLTARREQLRAEVERRRADLSGAGGHTRVPTTAADLLATLDLVLTFAAEVGAVNPAEAERLRAQGRTALLATAAAQAEHQGEADPAERFVSLLASVLSSGRGHLAAPDGSRPDHDATAVAVGWRKDGILWRSEGPRLGWLAADRLHLDPGTADAAVRRLAEDQGQPLLVTGSTLWKHLYEAGRLAETDRSGGKLRYKVRVTAGGCRRQVIVIPADLILAEPASGDWGYGGIGAPSAPIDGFP